MHQNLLEGIDYSTHVRKVTKYVIMFLLYNRRTKNKTAKVVRSDSDQENKIHNTIDNDTNSPQFKA